VGNKIREVDTALEYNRPGLYSEYGSGAKGTKTFEKEKSFFPINNANFENYFLREFNENAPRNLFGLGSKSGPFVIKGSDHFANPEFRPGSITLGHGYESNPFTVRHEAHGHALQGSADLSIGETAKLPLEQDLLNLVQPKNWLDRWWLNKQTKANPNFKKDYDYLTNSNTREAFPFLVENRAHMVDQGLLKTTYDPITKKTIKASAESGRGRLTSLYPWWKRGKLADIWNIAPSVISGLGLGTLGALALQQKKQGGTTGSIYGYRNYDNDILSNKAYGGGYFPEYHSWAPPRMDVGGSPCYDAQGNVIPCPETIYHHQKGTGGLNYDPVRTVSPYLTNNDIKKYTQAPASPSDVNFITNFAKFRKTFRNYGDDYNPTEVPYKGEKHWNINRFIIDPHLNVAMSDLNVDKSTPEERRASILADMYKYYMLQDPEHKRRDFRKAKKFVRNEVDPIMKGAFYNDFLVNSSGTPNFNMLDPINTFADENPLRSVHTWNEGITSNEDMKKLHSNYKPEEWNDDRIKNMSMDYLINYKKMSKKDAAKQWQTWTDEEISRKNTEEYLSKQPHIQRKKVASPKEWANLSDDDRFIREQDLPYEGEPEWNVEYYDPILKKTNTKHFNTNEQAEQFYNDPANKASAKYSDLIKHKYGGGLLSRTVTCSRCGHSWKGVTGGLDPLTCHDCGGMIKMNYGGDPSIAQPGKKVKSKLPTYEKPLYTNVKNDAMSSTNNNGQSFLDRTMMVDYYPNNINDTSYAYTKQIPGGGFESFNSSTGHHNGPAYSQVNRNGKISMLSPGEAANYQNSIFNNFQKANGGDISIPDLNTSNWLKKYKVGGASTGWLGKYETGSEVTETTTVKPGWSLMSAVPEWNANGTSTIQKPVVKKVTETPKKLPQKSYVGRPATQEEWENSNNTQVTATGTYRLPTEAEWENVQRKDGININTGRTIAPGWTLGGVGNKVAVTQPSLTEEQKFQFENPYTTPNPNLNSSIPGTPEYWWSEAGWNPEKQQTPVGMGAFARLYPQFATPDPDREWTTLPDGRSAWKKRVHAWQIPGTPQFKALAEINELEKEKNMLIGKTAVQLADPTGVSMWGDTWDSYKELYNNPSVWNATLAGVNTVASLPIIKYAGEEFMVPVKGAEATAKVAQITSKLEKLYTKYPQLSKLQKTKNAVTTAGKTFVGKGKQALNYIGNSEVGQVLHYVGGEPFMKTFDKATGAEKLFKLPTTGAIQGFNKMERFGKASINLPLNLYANNQNIKDLKNSLNSGGLFYNFQRPNGTTFQISKEIQDKQLPGSIPFDAIDSKYDGKNEIIPIYDDKTLNSMDIYIPAMYNNSQKTQPKLKKLPNKK